MYVCREKEVGGLGIKDLRALNLVLLEEGLSGGYFGGRKVVEYAVGKVVAFLYSRIYLSLDHVSTQHMLSS